MPTNRQGPGKTNIVVNAVIEEKEFLERIALGREQNLSDLVRELIVKGLVAVDPKAAEEVQRIRHRHATMAYHARVNSKTASSVEAFLDDVADDIPREPPAQKP